MSSAFLAPMSAGPSMQIHGLTIPNDVLGHILSSSPDFDTLHAALSVCTAWHRVFETHPKSVLEAVARNVMGPALPQAVRFIRYPYPEKSPNDWPSADRGGEEEDPEATEDSDDEMDGGASKKKKKAGKPNPHNPMAFLESESIGQLSPEERVRLQKNADIAEKLEVIFSRKYKKAKKLTALESYRFRRAMYRVMLYCELFYLPLNLDDIDAMEDNEPGVLDKIQEARHGMLNEYSTPDLFEVLAVVEFLNVIISEVVDEEDFERLKDICIATGPAVILEAYTARSSDVFEEALEVEVMTSGEDNALFGGFFSTPLERIWEERDEEPPADGMEMDAIIEEIDLQPDACAQCGALVKPLWSEANWHKRISVDFCVLLPGLLNSNELEAEALVELLMGPTGTADVVISEIYDSLLTKPTSEWTKWKKEDSLCEVCLDKLLGAHLHLWAYGRKVKGGWKATQNCWYGYNCKTQVHKPNHAKEKNHLCTPIR
ncbi:hypothetical protein MVEN_01182300 [Mycena venus]|uniref:F-box domain-containing protein n=1 Tax=Mycena venus TaxID=2733690 RepID=A0A8H6Y5S7_9AGAR|nr:hypothetical protein MVEN_01182300 [Mycena venus]